MSTTHHPFAHRGNEPAGLVPVPGDEGQRGGAEVEGAGADLWVPVGAIVRGVDRQLESVRSVLEAGAPTDTDPGVVESRRAAADVAARCAAVTNAPVNPPELVEMARSLASVSALALMLLDPGRSDAFVPPIAADSARDGTDDILIVLGDAVTERFRLLANACAHGTPSWPPRQFVLPVEIFLRQLDARGSTEPGWSIAALWAAIALKVAEAALWWQAAPPTLERQMGAPG